MNLDPSSYGLMPVGDIDQVLLEEFSCGTDSLDFFLKSEAKSFQEGRISNTYCVFHQKYEGIVGYFSLSNNSINLETSEVMDLGLNITTPISSIPAVLIGKFAVKKELQNCGNGKNIMDLAIGQVIDASAPSCARLLVVDAIKDAVSFYESCSFRNSLFAAKRAAEDRKKRKNNNPKTIKMFLDVLS